MLVESLRRRRRYSGDDSADGADDALDHVAPVRVHVQDQPAAAGAPIVPARALARLLDPVEHPPPELQAEADDAAQKSLLGEARKLAQPRQVKLVLDGAVLEAAGLGLTQERHALGNGGG